jgi:hypothetical protein
MSKKLWTKDAVIKDASKYKTLAEWYRNSGSAYVICCRNKWNDEACAHMTRTKQRNGYWTARRIIAESKKYQTTGEWRRANSASYSVAKKAHLVPGNMRREKIHSQWTKAKIQKVASQCKTRGELRSTFPSAYTIAATRNWLDDVCSHMLNKAPWFGPRVIREFLIGHDIPHQLEHKFRENAVVGRYPFDFYLPAFNLVIEYHGRQHEIGWGRDATSAIEIQTRDRLKKDFCKRAGINYLEIHAATKASIIKLLTLKLTALNSQGQPKTRFKKRELTAKERKSLETAFLWNEDSVREAISKCASVKEFREKYPSALGYAQRTGIWKAMSEGLKRINERGKYTKHYVAEMAERCSTRKEFRAKYPKCASAAQRNGWLAEVCKHMPKHLQKPWLG